MSSTEAPSLAEAQKGEAKIETGSAKRLLHLARKNERLAVWRAAGR